MEVRYAVVTCGLDDNIVPYLPSNYRIVGEVPIGMTKSLDDVLNKRQVIIAGVDSAGWTLDGYVLPRLATGLYFGHELVKPSS